MSTGGFHATVDETQFDAEIDRIAAGMVSQPSAMALVARQFYQFVINTFRDQTDPWGVPWPAMSDTTKFNRQHRKDNPTKSVQLLVDSRDMLNSVEPTNDATSATITVGAGLEYAAAQQFGNPANTAWGGPSAPIPPRPYMPLRTPDEAAFPQPWIDQIFLPIQNALDELVRA